MNPPTHTKRTSSHALKQLGSNARPARPVLGTKRSSYRQSSQQLHSNPLSPGGRRAVRKQSSDEEDMASFLQFCTTCETQITSPNPSLLYCSEACRKRDARQSYTQSPTLSPTIRPYIDHHLPDIIPQRSPTILRPLSELSLSSLSSSMWSEDEEPTASSPSVQDLPGWPNAEWGRGFEKRMSVGGTEGIPSLVHSPASSYGTVTVHSLPATRPLPPRRATTTAKSVDLVICTFTNAVPSSAEKSKSQARASVQTPGRRKEGST